MNTFFTNRISAGQKLAENLQDYQGMQDTVVIGIARNGIPVAIGIAEALNLDVDILNTQPIVHSRRTTTRLGIMAGHGSFALDPKALDRADLRHGEFTRLLNQTKTALNESTQAYRNLLSSLALHRKCVILVDDGVRTGLTLKAAIKAVQQQQPSHIMVAIPAGSIAVIDSLRCQVEGVACSLLRNNLPDVDELYEESHETASTLIDHWLESVPRRKYPEHAINTSVARNSLHRIHLNSALPYSLGIRAQWCSYFREFSRMHQGWNISVKVFNLPVAREQRITQLPVKASRLIRKPIEHLPLVQLRYEPSSDALVFEYQDGARLRHWHIEQPLRISCREQLSQRKELRIENQQGVLFSIQLQASRNAALPFSASQSDRDATSHL